LGEPKKSSLGGSNNILLARIKESNNNMLLSNIDTDYLQQ
jgi:hypothetical protein